MRNWGVVHWGMALLALTAFVLSHSYTGIRHDGILYLAQALKHLDPTIFSNDLFFKYGSQDSFTIFGRLYAALIRRFGLEVTSMAGLILAQFGFVAACVYWARHIVSPACQPLVFLLIAFSSSTYGGFGLIHYGEPFLTARSFAEVLSILSLASVVVFRRHWALALALGAATLHPLIALPAVGLWWITEVQRDRRWLLGLILVPVVLALGYLGVEPFSRFFEVYDKSWRDLVELHNFVFMSRWPLASWCALLADLVLLHWASRVHNQRLKAFAASLLLLALFSVAVSLVAADWLSNVFITSLQLWRVQWLVHFVAVSLLAPEVYRLFNGARSDKLIGCVLLYGLLFQDAYTGSLAILFAFFLRTVNQRAEIVISRITLAIVVVALILAAGYGWRGQGLALIRLGEYLNEGEVLSFRALAALYLRLSPVGTLLLLLPIFVMVSTARLRVAGLVVSVCALLSAATLWDGRSDISKILDRQNDTGAPIFSQFVPPSAEVYWQGEALAPWLLMHRKSYASSIQAAGIVFNRGTALEVQRRRETTEILDMQRDICGILNVLRSDTNSCAPDVFSVQSACESDIALDYIVMPNDFPGWSRASWTPDVRAIPGHRAGKTYYLYECRQITSRSEKAGKGA